MIKVDLVTGFLGSGKTTFIRTYAKYLMDAGKKIGIIENDFGAINVDMMMLQDLEGDQCELEPIVGGNVVEDWKRRFKAKLISMAMQGYDRVIVEPSGIYDVDVFFDMLYDEPLSNWFEVGNIFAMVDAKLDARMSKQAEYLLTSQVANAGKVILSKAEEASAKEKQQTVEKLNAILEKYNCKRSFKLGTAKWEDDQDVVLAKDSEILGKEQLEGLLHCGYVNADHKKLWFDKNEMFTSLFFVDQKLTEETLQEKIKELMQQERFGTVFRVKGFLQKKDGKWLSFNATHDQMHVQTMEQGQDVLIVIGEHLAKEEIEQLFK